VELPPTLISDGVGIFGFFGGSSHSKPDHLAYANDTLELYHKYTHHRH
jgi:hypothetical protein